MTNNAAVYLYEVSCSIIAIVVNECLEKSVEEMKMAGFSNEFISIVEQQKQRICEAKKEAVDAQGAENVDTAKAVK